MVFLHPFTFSLSVSLYLKCSLHVAHLRGPFFKSTENFSLLIGVFTAFTFKLNDISQCLLVCTGCYVTRWCIPENVQSKSQPKVPADLVLGEGALPGSQTPKLFTVSSRKRAEVSLLVSLIRTLIIRDSVVSQGSLFFTLLCLYTTLITIRGVLLSPSLYMRTEAGSSMFYSV